MNFKAIGLLNLLTALGILSYWIAFFTIGLAPANAPEGYLMYEHSFPIPDTTLAFFLLISSWLIYKGSSAGMLVSTVCAGALIFLGLLDTSFNYQNGIYNLSAVELISNAAINAWCVLYGGYMAVTIIRNANPLEEA